ncbi:MAG: HD domain-containing protein [Candidatus Pacearchaeota archaeon]
MEKEEYQKKIETITCVAGELMPKLPYHNFGHAIDVYSAANTLALLSNVDYEERFLLRTSALLHDIIVVPGRKDNEERSAEFVSQYLPKIGYSTEQAKRVGKIILATKMPQNPNGFLEQVLCDADLDNLGRPDFFELGEKVRAEFGFSGNERWYQQQIQFLRSHQYHTEVARQLRDTGKAANIQKLEMMLQELKC